MDEFSLIQINIANLAKEVLTLGLANEKINKMAEKILLGSLKSLNGMYKED